MKVKVNKNYVQDGYDFGSFIPFTPDNVKQINQVVVFEDVTEDDIASFADTNLHITLSGKEYSIPCEKIDHPGDYTVLTYDRIHDKIVVAKSLLPEEDPIHLEEISFPIVNLLVDQDEFDIESVKGFITTGDWYTSPIEHCDVSLVSDGAIKIAMDPKSVERFQTNINFFKIAVDGEEFKFNRPAISSICYRLEHNKFQPITILARESDGSIKNHFDNYLGE